MRFLISVMVILITSMTIQASPDCGCSHGGICKCDACSCDGELPNDRDTKAEQLEQLKKQIAALQDKINKYKVPLDYWTASALAVKEQKPLVFFYGVGYPRPIAGCIVGSQDYGKLDGFESEYGKILVSVPSRGWLDWRASLPADATDGRIVTATKMRAVSRSALPFSQREPAERDADLSDEVSSILVGMVPYRSTRVTQVSGNRSGGGSNSTVSRLSIPSKWQQPGGLEGLTGWSNKLYRRADNPVSNWLGHVDASDHWADGRVVANWGGLSEITHQRSYGEGAKFVDVLATPSGVFEVRVAEKVGGEWQRSVPYRDAKAEPAGYKRVSLQQCAKCHDQAGDGGYGTARVIGGDGVLSEPFPGLE